MQERTTPTQAACSSPGSSQHLHHKESRAGNVLAKQTHGQIPSGGREGGKNTLTRAGCHLHLPPSCKTSYAAISFCTGSTSTAICCLILQVLSQVNPSGHSACQEEVRKGSSSIYLLYSFSNKGSAGSSCGSLETNTDMAVTHLPRSPPWWQRVFCQRSSCLLPQGFPLPMSLPTPCSGVPCRVRLAFRQSCNFTALYTNIGKLGSTQYWVIPSPRINPTV